MTTTEPLLSPKFALALQFANEIHSTQARKGAAAAPYISHLMSVCALLDSSILAGTSAQAAVKAPQHNTAAVVVHKILLLFIVYYSCTPKIPLGKTVIFSSSQARPLLPSGRP